MEGIRILLSARREVPVRRARGIYFETKRRRRDKGGSLQASAELRSSRRGAKDTVSVALELFPWGLACRAARIGRRLDNLMI